MIVGVGFDLEDLEDFGRTLDQSGEAFLNRVYTDREIEYCQSQPHPRQSYAARYCAKEAAMKALGIAGMEGLKWRDFEIVSTSSGAPQLLMSGVAAAAAKRLRVRRLLVALSHSRAAAGAVVIAEGETGVRGHQKELRKSRKPNPVKPGSPEQRAS